MLKEIRIKNVALIDFCELKLYSGLNVLTGETGSGKSIIIDSLSFVFGARSDVSIIKSGENECQVEATFFSELAEVFDSLDEKNITHNNNEIVLYRKLTADNKTDCKVNGAKVPLTFLRLISSLLIDMHGQHENQKLLLANNQMDILDNFIGEEIKSQKNELVNVIAEINTQNKIIKDIGGSDRERAYIADFLKYQLKEINDAKIKEGELEELLKKRDILENKQKISENLTAVISALGGDEYSAVRVLGEAKTFANNIADYGSTFKNLAERISNASIEIADILSEYESNMLEDDEENENLDTLNDRIYKIKNIFKKYGDLKDIEKFVAESNARLDALENSQEVYNKCLNKISELKQTGIKISEQINFIREKFAPKFENLMVSQLQTLGMKNAQFKVNSVVLDEENFSKNGNAEITFLFSGNLGEPLKELSKVASGGELSRISLALKTITSAEDDIDSMIFDEIDTGISGAMGVVVAEKMAIVSRNKQVIVVSHLPQIAAMGDKNFLIEKIETAGKTKTSVRLLNENEKCGEVARLIGGTLASTHAMAHATELVENSDKFKNALK